MDVVFERTGEQRYAIEVRRPPSPVLRMDPAPGFDPWFPHDLQHLVVEEQLGLTDGIFGRLARGGTGVDLLGGAGRSSEGQAGGSPAAPQAQPSQRLPGR